MRRPVVLTEIIRFRDNEVIPEREVAGMSLKGLQLGNRFETVVHSLLCGILVLPIN